MPGPAPKRPQNRSRVPRGSALTVIDGARAKVKAPAVPEGVDLVAWSAFWASPLAQYAISTDYPALSRLFRMYEQRERYLAEGEKEPMTAGSTGQMALNPLLKEVDAIDAKILALEDRFGLSGIARLKLQVTLGDASKSLKELNSRLAATARASEADDDDERAAGVPAAPVRQPSAAHRR